MTSPLGASAQMIAGTADDTSTARAWTWTATVLLTTPVFLVASMYVAFGQLTAALGFPLGYFVAFAIYLFGWCTALPVALFGRRRVASFVRNGHTCRQLGWRVQLTLWSPLVLPLFYAFLPRIGYATLAVAVVSVVLALITAVSEEVLWRGAYVAAFPDSVWLNTALPSVGFGLWHLCPLTVLPSRYPGGTVLFVVYAIALGLSYAYVARTTKSIRWCIVSHCIHDALGLGGFAYARWFG